MSLTIDLPLPTNRLTNLVPVNKEGDFGTPENGVVTLKPDTKYLLNKSITSLNRFIIPTGAHIVIESIVQFAYTLTYTGTGTGFTAGDGGSLTLRNITIVGNSSAKYVDFDNGAVLFMDRCISTNWNDAGEIAGTFLFFNSEIDNLTTNGLVFDNRTDAQSIIANVIMDNSFIGNITTNPTTTLFDFQNTNLDKIEINGGGAVFAGNETLFNFDPTLPSTTEISLRNFDIFTTPTAIFAANSSKQERINSLFIGNIGIQSSTSIVKLKFAANSAVTTISTQDTPAIINSNVLYTIDSIIERFLIQDFCTFDNTGNTVDVAFNHGLVNTNRVFLFTYSGTLPAELDADTEYFVVNKNAADFQVSLTSGGAAVTFTDNGSGTLYYRHTSTVTQLAHMIYVGKETIKIREGGGVSLKSVSGTKIDVSATIMDIATNGTITTREDALPDGVTSSESGVSPISNVSTLSTGQGTAIYIENESNTTNLTAVKFMTNLNQTT